MMRSLYSGVSGMQNHQTRMDVIGNNVSNVNTYGFKRGRVDFQDMISQQINGAASPTTEKGGVNPKEVGLGMSVAAIDTIFTQGNLQSTGVTTDIAIQGNGFFVLKNGDKTMFTRNGAFGVDKNGTLVNPANGLKVQGWMAQDVNGTTVLSTSATATDLTIPVGQKDPPKATTEVTYACNLDKNTPEIPENATEAQRRQGTWSTSIEIYDTYGKEHNMQMNFSKVQGNPNQWTVNTVVDPENADATQTRVGFGTTDGVDNTYTLNFDNYGELLSITDSAGNVSNPDGEIIMQASYTVPDSNVDENGNPYRQTFNLNLGTIGSMKNTITQSASTSSTKARSQDGYKLGYLDNFKIDSSGIITGVYSNGSTRTIGQIAMASFTNQGGLEKAGDNTYVESINSGMANIGESGIAGKGTMLSGTLEMSNVDLTEQLTDMIVTQRGFQSNAKTIQTADTLLETVLSLKR
ncbi:MAG: flagellar hook protein FlgE [Treponema sp.]